jgi:hypothetical protein
VDEEQRRRLISVHDPLADQREVMPSDEFDAVDYFVHEPGRSAPPPPRLAMYLASGLTQAALADRLAGLVEDAVTLLAATVPTPMAPASLGYALVGEQAVEQWWDESVLEDLRAGLRAGQVELFGISIDIPNHEEFWDLGCRCLPDDPQAPQLLSLLPGPDMWPANTEDDVAERLLGLLESWTPLLDLRTGCVTLDRATGASTALERWLSIEPFKAAPLTREYVRGYCWANLLTGPHVDRLGGLEALRAKASEAGFVVRVLDQVGSAPPAVVVRAPGPVTSFDDTQLAAMKQLLGPVLLPRRYSLYQGYPLRIVPDPGTAFRRVPPGSPFPRLLRPAWMEP